jgi:multiple sugar transport system substrate-binding protein
MKKIVLSWFVVFTLLVTACSGTNETANPAEEVEQAEQADITTKDEQQSVALEKKQAEENAAKAQAELESAKLEAEKAAADKAEAERLLAEAKSEEERIEAEKKLAELQATEKSAAQALAKANMEKVAADNALKAKVAAEKAAVEKRMTSSATTTNTDTKTPAKTETANKSSAKEPITLKIYTAQPHYNNDKDAFENEVGQFLKKKFPHITVERMTVKAGSDSLKTLQEFIVTGDLPDIIMHAPSSALRELKETNLLYDLQDQIKKNKFDLSIFDQSVLDTGRIDEKIYAFPYLQNIFVLFYNKNVFDKFGVPYPKEGMTWDEVHQLAKQLTRVDGGKQYRGLSSFYSGVFRTYNQLSLNILARNEDKAAVNTEEWKRSIQNLARFYEIPGNAMAATREPASFDLTADAGFVAMSAHTSEKYRQYEAIPKTTLNWDMVSLPTFSDKPGVGAQSNPWSYFITNSSKHKDAAFEVISYLVSLEVQAYNIRKGLIPPYNYETNQKLKNVFGVDQPLLNGKNKNAFFYNKIAPPPLSRADNTSFFTFNLASYVDIAFEKVARKQMDINSALREAEELINKKIAEEKASKK